MKKKAIVAHSGGMDSSICLYLASQEFGPEHVLSLTFYYHQRNAIECQQAAKIAADWGIDHQLLSIDFLAQITQNALTHHNIPIEHALGQAPSTLVVGRNGLLTRCAAILAHQLGAHYLFLGVENLCSDYRDCSREYMELKQQILRIDLDDPLFEIRTPLIYMTKKETMDLAHELGILDYLWQNTVSCYEGIFGEGCKLCPSCKLRNAGMQEFLTISS